MPLPLRGVLLAGPALLAALAAGCVSGPPVARAAVAPVAGVIRRGDLEDRFLLTGALKAVRSHALIAPRTPVWTVTLRWIAPEGSQVKVGDPVVRFEVSSLQADLEDKRLAVGEAERELARTQAEVAGTREEQALAFLQARVARDKAALDAAVPAELQPLRDYQEKQLALEKAEAALQKAQRDRDAVAARSDSQVQVLALRLEKARRDLQRSEAALDGLTLRAPADGLLIHGSHPWEGRKWQVGDTMFPGMVAAEVPDLTVMAVEALLSDVDDGQIRAGLEARVWLDAFPQRSFAGVVRDVSEVAEARTQGTTRRFFLTRVELAATDPAVMRPGMSAKVEVLRRRYDNVLLAPREALDLASDPPLLKVRGAEPVPVRVAACDPIACVLESGPPEGTLVGDGG
jgi:multidrug efflux pump subunit AcrA (membrane-fusion protein)